MSQLPRSFVAVGGGQATATAVRLLRRRGFDGPVTVLAGERHAPYQRPPLSKEFLRGESTVEEATLLDEAWCIANEVDLRLGTRAESVEPGKVRLEDGSVVPGDAILLATGARSRRLPGVEGDRVLYLRTLDDAIRLRDLLSSAERIAIVGGGLIGSEVASSARDAGVAVTVLEAGTLPMLTQLGPRMARFYADLHREFGVDFRCGQEIGAVDSTADGVVVRTADGAVEADLVVVAVGAAPNDEIAEKSGLAVDPVRGGIVVDDACRTAMPGVFAAGDVAARAVGEGFVRVEHFDNAVRQGTAVAKTLIGKPAGAVDDTPWFWSDQYELGMQFLCRPHPDADLVVRGSVPERDFTAFYTTDGVVHAAFAMGRGGEIPAVKQLITMGLPVSAEALADDDTDLFELLDTIIA
ncbi:NAD(P)/FAD-dependent oxidoreductase [Amycolatopsis taiwanensis]|uniref:Pyridine nucleotide-disulfide oxidoreductase n=1 Tax=Amycolatopsis taiwanensis TaxID=342230 RepID=A0A9W6R6Y2_9PSEU|nr:FAD-dependent oxidoreductase [Amycolatopsis taiwanensis]GLY69883.1 pyridine nucleotide-disulfide oxidoreductase [Amycolatopsis taiwanensis]